MERLTRRELADVNGKQIVLCDSKEEDCNDSCLYRRCKWNEKALRKLKEYEDAEEQGLLLRLPCKVGDTLWWTNAYGDLCSSEVNSMFIEHGIDGIEIETLICNINEKEIGKTVFLAKEEAEQVLARMEKENEQIDDHI